MMRKDPRHHVLPGQPLRLAAEQVNAINRMSRVAGGATAEAAAPGHSAPYTWVYCKNTTGATAPRWGILAISGVQVTPTNTSTDSATVQFQSMPVLSGAQPAVDAKAWCVALEPIPAGGIGKVAVAGVVQCRIDVKAEADTIAGPKASTAELESGRAGAEILWKQSGLGTNKWALVRFGGSGPSDIARFGEVDVAWNKGTYRTVTRLYPDGTDRDGEPKFPALNQFASLAAPAAGETRWVMCVLVDTTWMLIAAEC